MSTASKVTFGLCCAVSFGTIFYVHYKQEYDRQQLRLGVVRDVELQERRRIENIYRLEQQKGLTKALKKLEEDKNNVETS